jgi:hypothetical protein
MAGISHRGPVVVPPPRPPPPPAVRGRPMKEVLMWRPSSPVKHMHATPLQEQLARRVRGCMARCIAASLAHGAKRGTRMAAQPKQDKTGRAPGPGHDRRRAESTRLCLRRGTVIASPSRPRNGRVTYRAASCVGWYCNYCTVGTAIMTVPCCVPPYRCPGLY